MRTPLLFGTLLLGAALAGCAGGDEPDGGDDGGPPTVPPVTFDPAWAVNGIPFREGHDHDRPEQHAGLSTSNFEVLGWDPLVTEYHGRTSGGYLCGDAAATAEGRRLVVVHSFTTDVAFVIADVTDPARPTKLGEYVLENSHVYDVAITPDGKHVILGTDDANNPQPPGNGSAPSVAPMLLRFRSACGGPDHVARGPEQPVPFKSGAVLIGIEDPAQPKFEDYRPLPILGPHSVSADLVDGRTLVIASVTNLVHQGSFFHFLEVVDTPAGPKLVDLSTYQAPPQPSSTTAVTNGHVDALIQKHPVTGRTYAYLADWDAGLVIVDITDPRTPQYVSSWTDFEGGLGFFDPGGGSEKGAIHEALPIEGLWDGKHYTFAGQELGERPSDRPTGNVHVLDTTDPARPTKVGAWTLPVDVEWDEFLQFSTHYVGLVDRTLFVTLYHGGMWAVDVSTPEKLADPPTIGVLVPDRVSPSPPPLADYQWPPTVLDVTPFPNGDMAVFDAASGVYMVRFDASNPAPAPPTWAAQGGP